MPPRIWFTSFTRPSTNGDPVGGTGASVVGGGGGCVVVGPPGWVVVGVDGAVVPVVGVSALVGGAPCANGNGVWFNAFCTSASNGPPATP